MNQVARIRDQDHAPIIFSFDEDSLNSTSSSDNTSLFTSSSSEVCSNNGPSLYERLMEHISELRVDKLQIQDLMETLQLSIQREERMPINNQNNIESLQQMLNDSINLQNAIVRMEAESEEVY